MQQGSFRPQTDKSDSSLILPVCIEIVADLFNLDMLSPVLLKKFQARLNVTLSTVATEMKLS